MGGRAASAAFYPNELIVEILRGIRDQADLEYDHLELDPEIQQALPAAALVHDIQRDPVHALQDHPKSAGRTATLRYLDGSTRTVCLDDHVKKNYTDEYTGQTLPQQLLEDAMHDELAYFNDHV